MIKTGKGFGTLALAVVTLALGACAPTVSPEGYVTESGFQRYKRNLPTLYTGQRHVILKPPAYAAAASTPVYHYEPAVPAAPVLTGAPVVTSQTLPPPAYVAPSPMTSPDAWTQASDSVVVQETTTTTTVATTAAPERVRLIPPSQMQTREVDYGDSITIYPLDSRDAAMPYIPPAPRPPVPLVTPLSPVAPAGYNQ